MVPWRVYVDRVFEEKEKAHRVEMIAAQQALQRASEALTHRLEAMNEFRAQIQEERSSYVTRPQLELLNERISQQEKRSANQDGRIWALGVGLTVGLSILTIVMNVALRLLR